MATATMHMSHASTFDAHNSDMEEHNHETFRESVGDMTELAENLFLYMDMYELLKQMGLKPMRTSHTRIMRANEPSRYCSRCPACGHGTYDVFFDAHTLSIEKVECASTYCTDSHFNDWPSGAIRMSSARKHIKPGVCTKPAGTNKESSGTKTTPGTNAIEVNTSGQCSKPAQEVTSKRKRGRPPGSKNKNGTKKSRAEAARRAMLESSV